jgi:amino-acid N-acetyltransferase
MKKVITEIKKANMQNAEQIHRLVSGYSKKGLMLARPLSYIQTRIRDFFVCVCDKKMVGCVALKIWNKEWAEIIALAVYPKYQKRGIGLKLIEECVSDARNIGIRYVLMLTFQDNLAKNTGFKKMDNLKIVPEVVFTEKTVNIDKAYLLNIS